MDNSYYFSFFQPKEMQPPIEANFGSRISLQIRVESFIMDIEDLY